MSKIESKEFMDKFKRKIVSDIVLVSIFLILATALLFTGFREITDNQIIAALCLYFSGALSTVAAAGIAVVLCELGIIKGC